MEEYINVEELRNFIVNDILRNPYIMFNDNIRGEEYKDIDLIGVIVGMYEIIHRMKYHEAYDYMFHWANKVGSWVETDYLKELIEGRRTNK